MAFNSTLLSRSGPIFSGSWWPCSLAPPPGLFRVDTWMHWAVSPQMDAAMAWKSLTVTPRLNLFAFYWLLASVGPVISIVYPLTETLKVLERPSSQGVRQWLTYWIAFSILCLGENVAATIKRWDFIYTVLRLGLIVWMVYPGCNGAETLFNVLVRPFMARKPGQGRRAEAGGAEMEPLLAPGAEGGAGGGGGSGALSGSAGLSEKAQRLSPEVQDALSRLVANLDSDEAVDMLLQCADSVQAKSAKGRPDPLGEDFHDPPSEMPPSAVMTGGTEQSQGQGHSSSEDVSPADYISGGDKGVPTKAPSGESEGGKSTTATVFSSFIPSFGG